MKMIRITNLKRAFHDRYEQFQDVAAQTIISDIQLPQLEGAQENIERASTIRRDVLAYMCFHRKSVQVEVLVLDAIRRHSDALWWLDMYDACRSTSVLYRLLSVDYRHQNKPESTSRIPAPATTVSPSSTPADKSQEKPSTAATAEYFIDAENVSYKSDFVANLMADPTAHVTFCISNCGVSLVEYKHRIQSYYPKANSFVECDAPGTKNALDFQLVLAVGQHLARNPYDCVRVISNDTGYDVAINSLRKQGHNITRIAPGEAKSAAPVSSNNTPSDKMSKDEFVKRVTEYANSKLSWKKYNGSEKKNLINIIVNFSLGAYAKEKYHAHIHGAIGKNMGIGNSRVVAIYNAEKGNIGQILAYAEELKSNCSF